MKNEPKDIFFNRAEVENMERILCDKCFERVVFMLRDQNGNEFSLGLRTVLQCLSAAIQNGDLPKLPLSWVSDVNMGYDNVIPETNYTCSDLNASW